MSASRPSLSTGDFVAALSLPDAAGESWDLSQQSIAHLHRVLVFSPLPDPSALAAAETRARENGAMLVLILAAAPDGGPDAAPPRLFDPESQLSQMLGLSRGGCAVLTARGKIGFVGDGPEALEEALESLPPVAPSVLRSVPAPVLIIPEILEPALVSTLLRHWQKGEKTRDRVASAEGAAATGSGIKRRTDVGLDDRTLYETFAERLKRRVLPEMMRAFRFRAASFEPPRIGCYDAADAGAFGAHRDNRTPFTRHRRFALSLNLNTHGSDYEGGTLCFPEFGPDRYAPEAGGGAVFCCDLLHEAQPVTRGRRFAIFTFFTDAEGAQAEQALIRSRTAAGEGGMALR
ncbi:2OG-Fe(II) oxygenase family protein [Roseomonas elaeocarpi]|uniref:2OG-Fe(II) oxygenase family protein n=1 Tax=Roseomonas elaeocarpi TaxID=907779 RepID=A0ABV6JPZ4_9PROT